jgi:hypothetical protein
MSILKDLLETGAGAAGGGATVAGNVAGFRAPIGDMKKREIPKKAKKKNKKKKKGELGPIGNAYSFKTFNEAMDSMGGAGGANLGVVSPAAAGKQDFDSGGVLAKLKASAKQAENEGEDTTAFALEDEKGALVKVWVPDDQADDFETALEQSLNGNDEDEDEENSDMEIAEVLFNLRKDFDIVNVEWGDIEEDQEEELPSDVEEVPAPGTEGEGELGDESELGAEGESDDMTADAGGDLGVPDEEGAKTALQSVIDMMTADANARKAEAEAKAAEAKAKETEATAKMSADKVKQEEEILDMEAYYDKEKEEKDETKRLAQLAKYRHELASDDGAIGPGAKAPDVDVEPQIGSEEMGGMDDMDGMPPGEESEERIHPRTHGGDTHLTRAELGDLLLKALRR